MESKAAEELQVELFLPAGRIRGITNEVRGRRRLIDVLMEQSTTLRLESAEVTLNSMPSREFPSLDVEKRSILAAIPHETNRQQHRRYMLTTVVGRHETRQVQATILLPPLIVEGLIHLPQSIGSFGGKLSADPETFARFVSLTGAKLTLPGDDEVETPVLLVNRDLIAGISVNQKRRPSGITLLDTA